MEKLLLDPERNSKEPIHALASIYATVVSSTKEELVSAHLYFSRSLSGSGMGGITSDTTARSSNLEDIIRRRKGRFIFSLTWFSMGKEWGFERKRCRSS